MRTSTTILSAALLFGCSTASPGASIPLLGASAPAAPEAGAGETDAAPPEDGGTAAEAGARPLEAYRVGAPDDRATVSAPGVVLMGGGTDVDAAFAWMIGKSGGGDFLVVRASGTDAYNPYVYTQLGGVRSAETVIVRDRTDVDSAEMLRKVDEAEALFFAGGDQARYVELFEGTMFAQRVRALAARAPIGGTSAGLHVLGGSIFDARVGSVTSAEALTDPFDPKLTFRDGFLLPPTFALADVVTDSHFYERDRMGRSVAFVARGYVATGRAAKGLAVDEATAVLVEPSSAARVVGSGYAYFLRMDAAPVRCAAGQPLAAEGVNVLRIAGGSIDAFSFATFTGTGLGYTLAANAGALTSSRGRVY